MQMFAQESVMEIQNEKEAFERFKAKQIGIDYETLKKDLDDCEKRFPNNRYAGWNFKSDWELWQAATAQAVPEGFVLVEKELSWVKADHLACAEWEKNKVLFCYENRDIIALQIEEYRLRWCKNKAHKIMSEYKAMIEAQVPDND